MTFKAVLNLYPGAKYTIGPAIENGFYYDFDLKFNQENNTFKEITFEKNYQNIHKLDSKISNNNIKKLNKNDKILDYSNKNNFESKCQIESKPTASILIYNNRIC